MSGNCIVSDGWLEDSSYQTILRETHMIAFEFNARQREQRVSPFISEYISGNYDGRLLSDVMLEDNVIHPKDVEKALRFREQVLAGQFGEMLLRLMTPGGEYRWFRIVITCQKSSENSQGCVGVLEDVDVQMQYWELLRRRAEIDPVSGIYNRETFFEQTVKLLETESDKEHFLICFDIDRFKLINKLFGNSQGDQVLHYAGNLLQELVRPGETFGRLGNDMFAACLSRTKAETISLIEELGGKMRSYPLAFRFFLPAGVVPVAPGCTDPVNELCDRAVMAQHKIKGNYLCRYLFYDPFMDKKLEQEHILIANMETALSEGQFSAYFQPKYDMRNGRIIGAEALARWHHPDLGMISPAEFVPLFERSGFIIKMDEYIWELVCRTIRSWIDRGITPVPVSVNVSRMHLYNKRFCSIVLELCRKYGIQPCLLELEITESAYTEAPQELFPMIESLQKAGFLFSMDDFGSGYSSLNILKDIPLDIVKFDLNFLKEARKGEKTGQSIVKNIIRLMRDLQVSIVAEGVENESQVQFLQEVDCHYAQGYFYARPMPRDEFELLLKANFNGRAYWEKVLSIKQAEEKYN